MLEILFILCLIACGVYFVLKSKNQASASTFLTSTNQNISSEFKKIIDELLDDSCVILDTETTGLNNTAEIVEISLILKVMSFSIRW